MEPPWEECSKHREVHVQSPWGEELVCWRRLEQEARRGELWEVRSETGAGWGADQAAPAAQMSLYCIPGQWAAMGEF